MINVQLLASHHRVLATFCILISLVVLPNGLIAQSLPQGGSRASATHDFVDLTGGSAAITDYVLFPYAAFGMSPGAFGIANRDLSFSQLTITNTAPAGSLTIGELGLGVGIDGRNRQPEATLHVAGGESPNPYDFANIFVEDLNDTTQLREMLRFENNGGIGISMVDNDTGTFFKMENVVNNFELASGPVHFRATANSSNNSLNLATDGVGIGTSTPSSTLHILADIDDAVESSFTSSTITAETKGGTAQGRLQLNCINNGPSILSMIDTNRPAFSQWMITNLTFGNVDALSLRKNASGAPNFTIFEDGNIRFTFNGIPNCTIKPNGNLFVRGSVQSNSDRNLKENINPVDPEEILTKVVEMPISTWNYNFDEDDIPHMGPMAQDFHRAFGLGVNDTTIADMDKDGVALAAIQGLNKKVDSKDATIAELKEDLQKQSEVISELTQRLERLESLVAASQK